jgi:hypothetical protein
MKRTYAVFVLFLQILFFAAAPLFADELATLTGYVSDPTGLRVSHCLVQVTNVATGVSYLGETNDVGLYRVPALPVGSYRVVVQKQGFKTIVKQGIELHVQDVVSLNFQMDVGSVSESVSVQGSAPLINTESAAVSTVIDRNFAENLPLNGRSFNTLFELTPGAVITPSSRSAPGQFSVNGQRTDSNSFSVDGVSANFGISTSVGLSQAGGGGIPAFNAYGGTSSLVSIDALQEFRVQTSSFSAEYGSSPGGQVSIETRPGTNAFHGGLFEYFRNDILDANDWFANASGLPRAAERQNDFGGFLGGPIIHNRSFFFFSYEGLQLRQPRTSVISVPSTSLRNSAIAPAQIFLNAFPVPNGPVDPNNPAVAQFTGNFSDSVALNATSLRLDHLLTDRVSLFARYNYAPSNSDTRGNALSEKFAQTINTQTLTLGVTVLVRPNMSNAVRANYSLQTAGGAYTDDSFGGATPPSLAAFLPPPLTVGSGSGEFAPVETSPLDFGTVSANRATQINFTDNLSIIKGPHELKFGADYRGLYLSHAASAASPVYLPSTLAGFASTATVAVSSSAIRPGKALLRSTSLYAQDAWKLGRRLNFNYGLRWQVNPAPQPRDGTVLASWLNVNQPQSLQLAPVGTPVWKTTYNNLAPRLGIAYQPFASSNLVVRGGWGIFYDVGTGVAPQLLSSFPNDANVFLVNQMLPLSGASSITPAISSTPPITDFLVTGFTPDLKLPRSMQWNVAVEKQIAGQAVSLIYIGQNGTQLLRRSSIFRPNPDFHGFFILTHNQDSSNYQALQAQLRRPLAKGLQALLNYTWSHSIDTGSDDSVFLNSDAVISAQADRGSSAFDVRHNFSGALAYDLPKMNINPVLSAVANNWSIYGVMEARGGLPINVTARGVPIPGLLVGTRPDLVPGEPVWLDDPSAPGGQRLNSAAFSVPTQPRQGTLARNSITGFGLTEVDFCLAREFKMSEGMKLQFRGDIFNLFNHPNFANPLGSLVGNTFILDGGAAKQMLNQGLSANSQGFNPLYQTGGPRSVQLSAKVLF